MITLKITALTDVGKVRKINEDCYAFAKADEKNGVFVIADGMGGHKAGKKASTMACETICKFISEKYDYNADYEDEKIKDLLTKAVMKANTQIYNLASADEELKGMGTTAVVCIVRGDNLYVANVGDSRLYIIDNLSENIEQITVDHSYVQALVEKNVITREEAYTHPQKNIITRAIGTEFSVEADIFKVVNVQGKRVLMCTDGLTNMLTDEQLLNLSKDQTDIEVLKHEYTDLAMEGGGMDNITVLIAEI